MAGCVTKFTKVNVIIGVTSILIMSCFRHEVENTPFYVCSLFDDVDDQYWMFSLMFSNLLTDNVPTKSKFLSNNSHV